MIEDFDFESFVKLFTRAAIGEKTVISLKREEPEVIKSKIKILVDLDIIKTRGIRLHGPYATIRFTRLK